MINMFHYNNAINSFIILVYLHLVHLGIILILLQVTGYINVQNGMRHHDWFYIGFIESGIISPTKI